MARGNYPILIFPNPVPADPTTQQGGGRPPNCPDPLRQGKRIGPKLRELLNTLADRRIKLQHSPLGITPEMVLVLETVGTIQDFIQTVKKIEGLEWLAEYEVNELPPVDGFENPDNPDKNLKGRLFLVMTNEQALKQLQSLFKRWCRSPEERFAQGLNPLKSVFQQLYEIRPWNMDDRLADTGLIDDWNERAASNQDTVSFEAELWYHNDPSRRQAVFNQIRYCIKRLNGQIITECIIPDIAYHAILGQVNIARIREYLRRPETRKKLELFQCNEVMFLRPVGQCAVPIMDRTDKEVPLTQLSGKQNLISGDPVVALLDGMPLAGHKLLDRRLIIDDPDGYEDSYQAKDRSHGTAMASLICHGDLNSSGRALRRPIYVRPIMQPQQRFDNSSSEVIPENILPVDLVYRATVRIFDGEGTEPPASPNIRVISLSIGDAARPFIREMGAWARLLDWLSWKYNVLFIVSAGNHPQNILLETSDTELQSLGAKEIQSLVIRSMVKDTRNRRLLSPAETMNGVTVGQFIRMNLIQNILT